MAQFDYAASTPWEYTPSGMAWPDTFLLATALFAQQGITKGGKPSSFARFLSGRVRLAPATARRARTPHGEGKPSRLPRAVARPTVPGRPSRMSFISPRRARGDGRCPLGARRGMEKYNSYSSVSITALEQPRLKPPVPLRTFLANTI